VRLFVRGARGIVLTDDGRRLLERIAPPLEEIERALRPFAARHDEVLTISVTPSMASAWLVPRLARFLAPDRDDLWNVWFAQFGGQAPTRFVAYFDDSEALHRAAAAGVGVALGKLTRVRLLLESGQLLRLTSQQLRTDYAHYLAYPPRSSDHAGLRAFREWLQEEAREYDSFAQSAQMAAATPAETTPRKVRKPAAKAKKKSASRKPARRR
jgi:DNA-binding transcriptional LysR family regulator